MGKTKVQSSSNVSAKQFGNFTRQLALYVIGQRCNKPIELLEDIEDGKVKLPIGGCVLYARGRRIPGTESYNVTFLKEDIGKLKEMTERYSESFNPTPILAYVCVDNMENAKKIRVFWLTLADAEAMGDDFAIEFLNYSRGGITLRYTEGSKVKRLTEIKQNSNKMNYVELQFM